MTRKRFSQVTLLAAMLAIQAAYTQQAQPSSVIGGGFGDVPPAYNCTELTVVRWINENDITLPTGESCTARLVEADSSRRVPAQITRSTSGRASTRSAT